MDYYKIPKQGLDEFLIDYLVGEDDEKYDRLHYPTVDPNNRNGYDWLDWYGKGYHPGRDYNRGSGNQDFGDSVMAVADGVITFTEKSKKGFGNRILVKHDINHQKYGKIKVWSHYCHLEDIQVFVDDKVKSGDQIGTVGNTGKSTSAHLHFELRKKPLGVNFYPNGKSKKWVEDHYYSPDEFLN
jgi:murein DD-endopeptidase MepM/ murein hydrolase activator NlpD